MRNSILQYLVDFIAKSMLDTATPANRAERERCFKDLDVEDVIFDTFTTSKKTGLWTTKLSSESRRFNWPDTFSFRTQDLVGLLKGRAGEIKRAADVLKKTDFNGLFYAKDKNALIFVTDSLNVLDGKHIDLGTCILPAQMTMYNVEEKKLVVSHPFVQGEIQVVYR